MCPIDTVPRCRLTKFTVGLQRLRVLPAECGFAQCKMPVVFYYKGSKLFWSWVAAFFGLRLPLSSSLITEFMHALFSFAC